MTALPTPLGVQATADIIRPGVAPRFPKQATYLKNYGTGWASSFEKATALIERYGLEGEWMPRAKTGLIQQLMDVERTYRWHAIQVALSSPAKAAKKFAQTAEQAAVFALAPLAERAVADWREVWRGHVAYSWWHCRIGVEYAIENDCGCPVALIELAHTIAQCVLLGWHDKATALLEPACRLSTQGAFGGDAKGWTSMTHYFVLRLLADWKGISFGPGPAWAFGEPIFNALIAHVYTPDLHLIEHLLLAACDRHTIHSRSFTNKFFPDFDDSAMIFDPSEIVLVMYLRRLRGLENPVLDHPLMSTALAQLPDQAPVYTDPLLDKLAARL
ncbi:MAG: hypothetical protein V4723_04290 [Pseudomonadota bacterium]